MGKDLHFSAGGKNHSGEMEMYGCHKEIKIIIRKNMPGWQQVHGGCREEIKGYMEEEIYFRGNMS